jgi:hypothetical protein
MAAAVDFHHELGDQSTTPGLQLAGSSVLRLKTS